jgi:hypothetical protein
MKLFYKSILLILIVSVVTLFICYDIYKSQSQTKENFETAFQTTMITDFSPNQGDSSTTVIIKGRGLNYIEEVLFDDVECVILDNRNDQKMLIIPPALSELGRTIEEVRKKMNETGNGISVSVKLLKKDGGTSPQTSIALPDVVFTYIDKGTNWKDQCPKQEEKEDEEVPVVEAPVISTVIEPIDTRAEFKEDSDLYFLNVIVPEIENRLVNVIKDMEKKLEEKDSVEAKLLEDANLVRSHTNYLEYLKEMNILRYNIHKSLKNKYGN